MNSGRSKPENAHLKQIRSVMKLQNHLTLLNTIAFDQNNNCSPHYNWHHEQPIPRNRTISQLPTIPLQPESIREVHNQSCAVKPYALQFFHNWESPYKPPRTNPGDATRNSLFTAEEIFRRQQSITETISNRDVYVNQRFNDTEELALNSMNVSRILFTLEE